MLKMKSQASKAVLRVENQRRENLTMKEIKALLNDVLPVSCYHIVCVFFFKYFCVVFFPFASKRLIGIKLYTSRFSPLFLSENLQNFPLFCC